MNDLNKRLDLIEQRLKDTDTKLTLLLEWIDKNIPPKKLVLQNDGEIMFRHKFIEKDLNRRSQG